MNANGLLEGNRLGRKPFFVIAATAIFTIAISIYCLSCGWVIIFQNLFYVPIVIACIYYTKKGFAFSVILSFIYFFLMIAFTRDFGVAIQALIRVFIFILIAGITAFLSVKRQEAEAEKAKLKEQNWLHKTESLNRMAGAISHHFNNQLHVVMGYLDMVIEDLPPDDSHIEELATARQAAKKASEVSTLLITYLGQKLANLESHDISELCRTSLPLLQAGKPQNVTIETNLPPSGPYISADAKQFHQMLTNLIVNAWEAIDDKAGTIQINLKTVSPPDIPASHRFPVEWRSQEQQYACLEVTDSGCGIQEKDMDKLFDPFFSTKFTGRGLGLSVVLGIMKTHGAVITAESEINGGSVFKVFFPLKTTSGLSDKSDLSDRSDKPVKGGTVLLVEDEITVRKITTAALINFGFTVVQAKDGVEAVEIFKQRKDEISCVLCDLTMPRMGGWETISALRAIRHDLPVVLASGYDKATVMAGVHPELPDFFLNKPYELKKLGETIAHAMARGKR